MAFPRALHLNKQRVFAVGPEDSTYIFDMVGNSDESTLAVSASNHAIKLYDTATLALTSQLLGHEAQISSIAFSKHAPTTLWSSSFDGRVRVWDTRAQKQVAEYRCSDPRSEFSALGINCTETIAAAGTQLKGGEAKLCFWDVRGGALMKEFNEVHNDDITQVVFHPTSEGVLATGSTDGLVNVLDIQGGNMDEDDSIATVMNSESSVAKVGFFGPSYQYLYCNTHIESLYIWNAVEGTKVLHVPNVRDAVPGTQIDYAIGMQYLAPTQELYLLCATHSGTVEVVQVNESALTSVVSLPRGHKDVVRCFHYNQNARTLFTGGEDAVLCKWGPEQAAAQQHGDAHALKADSPSQRLHHRSTPY